MRGVWDPVIGAGPFMVNRVPKNMPLSRGVMGVMTFCAQKRMFGLSAATLRKYKGFDATGRVIQPAVGLHGKELKNQIRGFGRTIRDVAGDLLTIHGVVMTGNSEADQGPQAGTTTEENVWNQKGDRTGWWNRIFFGANVSTINAAKGYAAEWKNSIQMRETDADHEESILDHDIRMYELAAARVKNGTAHPLEKAFVQRWEGDFEDDDDTANSSTSDDDDEPLVRSEADTIPHAPRATPNAPLSSSKADTIPYAILNAPLSPTECNDEASYPDTIEGITQQLAYIKKKKYALQLDKAADALKSIKEHLRLLATVAPSFSTAERSDIRQSIEGMLSVTMKEIGNPKRNRSEYDTDDENGDGTQLYDEKKSRLG